MVKLEVENFENSRRSRMFADSDFGLRQLIGSLGRSQFVIRGAGTAVRSAARPAPRVLQAK